MVALALGLEAGFGYPDALHRRLPHPVTWAGWAIDRLELTWNRPDRSESARRALGVATVVVVVGAAMALGIAVQRLCSPGLVGGFVLALIATVGLAQNSLYRHVTAVLLPLQSNELSLARTAVGRIVGRDVDQLDEIGVCAAALESLAESFNDGVVAPAFWLLVAGLPGLFAYKALNTADSLIGHWELRWRAFGWAAARGDDIANLIPARLAGGLIALVAGRGWRIMLRDAPAHASPNAGWPEAAMAGALGVQLGGPAVYDGRPHERPRFGDGSRPGIDHLQRGLTLYVRACVLLAILLLLGGLLWLR
jgi:adenosylcobinamide-phosphate synthase